MGFYLRRHSQTKALCGFCLRRHSQTKALCGFYLRRHSQTKALYGFYLRRHSQTKVLCGFHLRWLPPVLHFPEPMNFTKGFLAHYDGLVPVLARWCYNSFKLLNSCTSNLNFVTMATIQRPKYTLYLPFDCILHKN